MEIQWYNGLPFKCFSTKSIISHWSKMILCGKQWAMVVDHFQCGIRNGHWDTCPPVIQFAQDRMNHACIEMTSFFIVFFWSITWIVWHLVAAVGFKLTHSWGRLRRQSFIFSFTKKKLNYLQLHFAIASPFFRPCPRAISTVRYCWARTFLDHCARRGTLISEKQVSK